MPADLLSKTRLFIAKSAYQIDLTDFSAWLAARHYAPVVIHGHVWRLGAVLPRMPADTVRTRDEVNRAFDIGPGPAQRLKCFRATHRAYVRFLLAQGRLESGDDDDRFVLLRRRYDGHLKELRGLSLSTRQHQAHTVADFLVRALKPGQGLDVLTLTDVERFIALRSRELTRHSLQHVVAHVRAFLRYCYDQGEIEKPLDFVDTPRTYRGELPPQALPWTQVQKLIASVDTGSKAGWRDHCILHLMAHYGLRPSEVVSLRLDSIDWDKAVLRVEQSKTGSDLLLPLAPQTLQILRRYLAQDRLRAETAHSELFLRTTGPSGALKRTAIGPMFAKRVRLANVGLDGQHVYRLRHTFAMQLLTRGVGVKAIGDLLGHRSLESTCAYLRLDIEMLRGVALDVPALGRHGSPCHG